MKTIFTIFDKHAPIKQKYFKQMNPLLWKMNCIEKYEKIKTT